MAVTIFVLFGDDIRILFFPPSADNGFEFFFNLSFIMFVLEMAIYFLVKSDFSKGILSVKGYAFSFFFWLDLLAVLAMVPDVGWLASNGFSPLDSLGENCILAINWRMFRMSNPSLCMLLGKKRQWLARSVENQALSFGWLGLSVY